MERGIGDVAQIVGTTPRTLRHYQDEGLIEPSRIGPNGYRYYDDATLVRIQRIMLLRDWGLDLATIRQIVIGEQDDAAALREHLDRMMRQRGALDRRIAAVTATVQRLERGESLMPEEMFDGFESLDHREEVTQRWGAEAWQDSERWWSGLSAAEQRDFMTEGAEVSAEWQRACRAGLDPGSQEALALARRHHAWVAQGWGGREVPPAALLGLAQMYVADDRFARYYGGAETAAYLEQVIQIYVGREVS